MSRTALFHGKLQARDDPDNLIITLDGSLGSGTQILLYKGDPPIYGLTLVTGQLQAANATPTQPSGLRNSYLTPVPYSGAAYKPNGVGNSGSATQFVFKDGPSPTFAAYDGPPGGTFGLWAYSSGGKFWGWSVASTPPANYSYTMITTAPSAAHIRSYLGGVGPANADYTWCDLSGEDWTKLSSHGARFAGADLSKTDFSGSDLTGADFRAVASVSGTNFTGANLTGADLRGVAGLTEAVLTNATLSGARLDGLNLTGVAFLGVRMPGVNLTGTTLADTEFLDSTTQPADLTGVDFSVAASLGGAHFGTGLVNADFAGHDLTGVDFTGAVMKGTNFHRCDLRPATFSVPPTFSDDPQYLTDLSQSVVNFDQLGLNWSFMDLTGTQIQDIPPDLSGLDAQSSLMPNWELSNHKLAGANLSNTDLRGAALSGCDFTSADMSGVQLQATTRAAVLTGSQMENADLSGANLTGATLDSVYLWGTEASVAHALVLNTSFANAYLTGLDFSSVSQNQCKGASFSGACLLNADFTGTDLTDLDDGTPVRMSKACLQGANFTDALLDGAELTSAAIAEDSGKFPVTIQNGWPAGNSVGLSIGYGATVGIAKATTHATTCPAGGFGPCVNDDQLYPASAPKAWPVPATDGEEE